ncbi:transmembrane protein, putative, partial [Bodo saltans]
FPSAIGCPPRGATPLTVYGAQLLPIGAFGLVFTFADNPDDVACVNLTHVDASTLVCTSYPGFGTNGTAVLYAVGDRTSVVASRAGLLTFGPNAASQCPIGTNGLQCSARGTCDAATGRCVCVRTALTGYWGGEDCGVCDARYNSSDGCMLACPVSVDGVVCSGTGWCANGQCWCGGSWTTSACDVECPGSGAVCSGHGTCDSESGTCVCDANAIDGSGFAGRDCSLCADGYSGALCALRCPTNPSGAICSGRGACFAGGCQCVTAYCGVSCELVVGVDDCGNCALPGLYGANCDLMCPGASVTNPCSGHGQCSAGRYGTGQCLCNAGFGQSDCSVACPSASGLSCGGLGNCSSLTGTCSCNRFQGGAACTVACPRSGAANLACGGHGTCDEGSSGTGACSCSTGYNGAACNVTCAGVSVPCNGRGVCGSSGTCACNSDDTVGHWAGDNCDICAPLYGGYDCTARCPTSNASVACSGHGTCGFDSVCACSASSTDGYWGGEMCSSCQPGYYGARCVNECPGGSCAPCSNHGSCSDGVNGTGACTCDNNATFGFWAPSDCTGCVAGWYGELCTLQCPRTAAGAICGNGTCNDGNNGDGTCVCAAGYATNQTTRGVCTACAAGYYGRTCAACPSNNSAVCSGHGVCSDGVGGSGSCACFVGFSGANCSLVCGVAGGRTCGNGTCVANNTCQCDANWAVADGTCSVCVDGRYGADCSLVCAPCVFGKCVQSGACVCRAGYFGPQCAGTCPGGATRPCSGNGTCDAMTGKCTCSANLASGFYVGDACASCDARYLSPRCNVPCPTFNGLVCYGRGTCFNGTCRGCAPLDNETQLIIQRCGSACQDIDSACFAVNDCPLGYYGPTCSTTCPGTTLAAGSSNALSTCAAKGLCLYNGTCLCNAGYYGTDCASPCPATTLGPCNSRGVCRDALCVCRTGAYGSAVREGLPWWLRQPVHDGDVTLDEEMTRGTANMLSVGSDRRIRCCGEVNKLLDVNLHPAMEMDSVEDTVMPDADDVIPDEGARSTVSAIVGSLGAAASGAILIRSSLSLQLAECASDDPGTNSSLSAALIGSSTSNLFQINVGSNVNTAGYGYRGALVSSVVLVLGAAILLSVAVVVKHCIERCHQPSHAVTWRTLTSESGLPGWWLVTCWALRSGRRAAPLRCGFPGQRLAMGCGHRCRGRRPSRGVATALVCAGSLVFQGVASAQASWLVHSGATRPCTRVATCAARCAVATGRGLRVGTVDMSTSFVVGLLAALPSLVVHLALMQRRLYLLCALVRCTSRLRSNFCFSLHTLPRGLRQFGGRTLHR